MALLALATAAVSGLAEKSGGQPEMSSASGRTQINVQPVGINLGAIAQPYLDNPFNGGFGLIDSSSSAEFSGGVKAFSRAPITFPGSKFAKDGLGGPVLLGGLLLIGAVALARM